jgi:hypothetical protein
MEVVAERPLSHRHAHQELFVARLTSVQYCCTALRAQASIPDSCTTTISIMYARWVSSDPILPLISGLCVRGVDAGTVPLPARLFFGGMLRWSRWSPASLDATVERVTGGMVRQREEALTRRVARRVSCGRKLGAIASETSRHRRNERREIITRSAVWITLVAISIAYCHFIDSIRIITPVNEIKVLVLVPVYHAHNQRVKIVTT